MGEGEHNAFLRLHAEIARKKTEVDRQDEAIAALPVALGAAFDSHNNEHQPKCLPCTRIELLADIDQWATATDQRCVCWLNGVAGSGKSTIARTVAAHYNHRGVLGASFFFSRESGELSNSSRFVTSLVRQLATNVPSAKRAICKALAEQRSISELSLREQWNRLILKPLSELKNKTCPFPLVFVIDALDECDKENDVRDILGALATAKTLNNIKVRVFISSRPELWIQSGFTSMLEKQRRTFVLHEQPPDRVNRDIKLLFEDYFQIIRKERGLGEDWPVPGTIEALVDRSCGLFAWASTACRSIREGSLQSQGHISMLSKQDDSGAHAEARLDQIYSTVLQSALSKQSSFTSNLGVIVGSIVVLRSPVSIGTLAKLLAKSTNDIHATLASLQSIFRLPDRDTAPIRLYHPTFRDYILSESRCTVPGVWMDESSIHKRVADSCVIHMTQELSSALSHLTDAHAVNSGRSHTSAAFISPALQYACLHWIDHYRRGRVQLCDGDRAHLFIESCFHLWVQAMDSMGRSQETGALLRFYQSLLTVRNYTY